MKTFVAFADPDSSTYAFRGADPGGVREFPDRFAAFTVLPEDLGGTGENTGIGELIADGDSVWALAATK